MNVTSAHSPGKTRDPAENPLARRTMSRLRDRAARPILIALSAFAAACLSLLVVALPANAATTLSATNAPNHDVDGCTVQELIQYDPGTNSSTVHISFHNGQWFRGCRVSLRGHLTVNLYGQDVQIAMPIHRVIGCGYWDPTCLHDVNSDWTDYNVVPPGLLTVPTYTPTALVVSDHPGYDDAQYPGF